MKYIRVYFAAVVLALGILAILLKVLNRSLIVDRPVPADLILVPSGDFAVRSERALYLAELGYGNHVLIDEGAETLNFGRTLAARRSDQLSRSDVKVSVCPIRTDSTYGESREATTCIETLMVRHVLIVTSDFHTRRALAIFRSAMPAVTFSVASTPTAYGSQPWWSISSIATSIEEWGALLWWRIAE
jgi:uncharacterized SAM-binding protein YcdF (DUF218 family)